MSLLRAADPFPAARDSVSLGQPDRGSLQNGIQLPPHSLYRLRSADRAWATQRTVHRILDAFGSMRTTKVVYLHDLSLRQGGPIPGHRSHQNGRDADIAYYQHHHVSRFKTVSAEEMDADSTWKLLHWWLARDAVSYVFIDWGLQKPLFESASRSGASKRQLARWFQFPRPPERRLGVIRHAAGHKDHFHVRFGCGDDGDGEDEGRGEGVALIKYLRRFQ